MSSSQQKPRKYRRRSSPSAASRRELEDNPKSQGSVANAADADAPSAAQLKDDSCFPPLTRTATTAASTDVTTRKSFKDAVVEKISTAVVRNPYLKEVATAVRVGNVPPPGTSQITTPSPSDFISEVERDGPSPNASVDYDSTTGSPTRIIKHTKNKPEKITTEDAASTRAKSIGVARKTASVAVSSTGAGKVEAATKCIKDTKAKANSACNAEKLSQSNSINEQSTASTKTGEEIKVTKMRIGRRKKLPLTIKRPDAPTVSPFIIDVTDDIAMESGPSLPSLPNNSSTKTKPSTKCKANNNSNEFVKKLCFDDEDSSNISNDIKKTSPPHKQDRKHGTEGKIKRNSRVRAYVSSFKKDGTRKVNELLEGIVLGAEGLHIWRIAFFGDSTPYRRKHSNQLTLVQENGFDSSSDKDSKSCKDSDRKPAARKNVENFGASDGMAGDDVEVMGVVKPGRSTAAATATTSTSTSFGAKKKDTSNPAIVKEEEYFSDSDDEHKYNMAQRRKSKQKEIDSTAGEKVRTYQKSPKGQIMWEQVLDDFVVPDVEFNSGSGSPVEEQREGRIGIKSDAVRHFLQNGTDLPLAHCFLYLSHIDADASPVIGWMNKLVSVDNSKKSKDNRVPPFHEVDQSEDSDGDSIPDPDTSLHEGPYLSYLDKQPCLIKYFTLKEYYVFMALVIGASDANSRGHQLWKSSRNDNIEDIYWSTAIPQADFSEHMSHTRFKEIKNYYSRAWENPKKKLVDPWWEVIGAVEEFNFNRKYLVLFSTTKVLDELMSAYRPCTSKNGGLPHITKLPGKPEDLGTLVKNASCASLRGMANIEVQRGKEEMEEQEHTDKYSHTAACSKRLAEQSSQIFEDGYNELIVADSWFGNINSLRAVTEPDEMTGERRQVIYSIKGGHSLFPKKTIETKLKGAPGGCHVIYRGYDEKSRQFLWAIGWKFNSGKTLSFLATQNAGSIAPSVKPYQIKYPDDFGNIRHRSIPRPGIVQKYFECSNAVDVHNQLRQSELALEKKWVTHRGTFRFHTTIIGINVVDSYLLAKHHGFMGPLTSAGVGGSTIPITKYAGVLSKQLLELAARQNNYSAFSKPIPAASTVPLSSFAQAGVKPCNAVELEIKHHTFDSVGYLKDRMGGKHTICKFGKKVQSRGKVYRPPHACDLCNINTTIAFCLECAQCFCFPFRRSGAITDLPAAQALSCFQHHVDVCKRLSERKRKKPYEEV